MDEDEAYAILAAWREAPGAGKDPAEVKMRIQEQISEDYENAQYECVDNIVKGEGGSQ